MKYFNILKIFYDLEILKIPLKNFNLVKILSGNESFLTPYETHI